jgi:hypothetical protein
MQPWHKQGLNTDQLQKIIDPMNQAGIQIIDLGKQRLMAIPEVGSGALEE